MIVGSKSIDMKILRKLVLNSDYEGIEKYACNLVPNFIQIPELLNNQKWYVALHIRKLKDIDFQIKKKSYENLLSNVRVIGKLNSIIDISEFLERYSRESFIKAIKNA